MDEVPFAGAASQDWLLVGQGDSDAFESVYRAHVRFVYAYVARRCDAIVDAEDVVSYCFEELWRQRRSVHADPVRGLLPWLFTVALRRLAAMNRLRSRELEVLQDLSHDRRPVDTASRSSLLQTIEQVVAEASPENRLIADLAWRDGLTSDEIGHRVGMPASTVRNRLQLLRRSIEEASRKESR